MNHALIIGDNMIISRAIQSRLECLGFTSFDHTWTEAQAVAAARHCAPNLVIIGDEVESGSALGAARRISRELAVPVLMVTGDPVRAERHLASVEAFEGPFLLNQIEEAVNVACASAGRRPLARSPCLSVMRSPARASRQAVTVENAAMATQPPLEPNRIEPLTPPEAPPATPEPVEPEPDETPPIDPGTIEPEPRPDEWSSPP